MFGLKKNDSKKEIDFFVILYGTYEYDGRVKRLVEVLESIGTVLLIDIAAEVKFGDKGLLKRRKVDITRYRSVVWRHLYFLFNVINETIRCRPRVIVGADYFSIIPARLASRLSKALFLYDAHELIIPEPGIALNGRERFWYLAEKLSIKSANLVIATNEDRARLMQTHYKLIDNPLVVRNIPPLSDICDKIEKILETYPDLVRKKPNELLLIYQGDISMERGIEKFVAALKYLPEDYRLVVVGGGPDIEKLIEIGRVHVMENRLSFLGPVENTLLPTITSMMDIGLAAYSFKGLNNIYCSPNKIYEYAQSGLPVVATNQLMLLRIVEKYGIGELFGEDDSPKKIAELIKYVVENKNLYKKALARFVKENSWEGEKEIVKIAVNDLLIRRGFINE